MYINLCSPGGQMPISTSDHSSLTLLPYIIKKIDPPMHEKFLYQLNVKLSIKDDFLESLGFRFLSSAISCLFDAGVLKK